MKAIRRNAHLLACTILLFMGTTAFMSMREDSVTSDEMPHIVAGYMNLTQLDFRLGTEHPPLVKQLAAFPMLFMDINTPTGYFSSGSKILSEEYPFNGLLLFKSGNDIGTIIFWGRIMIILLTMSAGFVVYVWTKEIFGDPVAGLIALILFALSPNILAHGRLTTLDMGVAAFSLFALYAWWKFVQSPTRKNLLISTILLGALHLSKFSSLFFIPVFGLMALWAILFRKPKWKLWKRIQLYAGAFTLALVGSFAVVAIWYQVFNIRMPLDFQKEMINYYLDDDDLGGANLYHRLTYLADFPVLRPAVHYLLGIARLLLHNYYGHTTFFMGEIDEHWSEYFLITYLIKEPIAYQLLLLLSLTFAGILICKKYQKYQKKVSGLVYEIQTKYDIVIAFLAIIAVFLVMGSRSKMQIGIRYILPAFPYLYMIMGGAIALGLKHLYETRARLAKISTVFVALCFSWAAIENIRIYPNYLAYFNQYIGGPKNAWHYTIDSNLDWGQNALRLRKYMDEHKIEKIKTECYSGDLMDYYLGHDRYTKLDSAKTSASGWIVVPTYCIQMNSGNTGRDGARPSYHWLIDKYEPVEKIGHSLFVYKICKGE